jgi:ADP-heptose:LPS heptosyltransferase
LKFLIIQTAFIGDVILATAVAEKLHQHYPDAQINFLVRKGNESLLANHPYIRNVLVWDKKRNKLINLLQVLRTIRRSQYDYIFNLHRFASSGFITALSGAKNIIGFDKNPLSFLFTKKIRHEIGNGKHETARNQEIIESVTDKEPCKPALYPSTADYESVKSFQQQNYICIAPTSVWFTKQFPAEKWVELCRIIPADTRIYLLGAASDSAACDRIANESGHKNIFNLAGKLSLLASAALLKGAIMNYVNDSAPLHMSSAMNAPTTAVFCSTVPSFGFGPLADKSKIVETKEKLDCRPCGLHGYKTCPEGHFTCALTIDVKSMV